MCNIRNKRRKSDKILVLCILLALACLWAIGGHSHQVNSGVIVIPLAEVVVRKRNHYSPFQSVISTAIDIGKSTSADRGSASAQLWEL
jgi:hypothetical protein